MPTEDCPHPALVRALIAGRLPEKRRAEALRHIADCSRCRQALQPWLLQQPELQPPDQALLSAIPLATPVSRPAVVSPALAFLEPSQRPDSLGRLGDYEILAELGRGGMGVVLRAFDSTLNRPVAIKVLAEHLASSSSARKRFLREARSAAAVRHPNVVAIHDVAEVNGQPFLVMQLVTGSSLQQLLEGKHVFAPQEIARIGMETAAGLAAAHAQGLIHRDVKPANILIAEDGPRLADARIASQSASRNQPSAKVKITDFGLARAIDDAAGLTQSGAVAGTPAFMSPEQARAATVDGRADLFSLGSVLYTLCTGRQPFKDSSTLGLLLRVCEEEPRPIRRLNPEIPEWLEALIARLMRKDPGERIQSAAQVAELLGRYLLHLHQPADVPAPSLPALPKVPRKQQAKPGRRIPWLAAAAAVGVLALLGLWWAWPAPESALLAVSWDEQAGLRVLVQGEGRRYQKEIENGFGLSVPPGSYRVEAHRSDGWTFHQEVSLPLGGKVGVRVPRPRSATASDTPFGDLKRAQIAAEELRLAGNGDPSRAPAELVAVLGSSRLRSTADVLTVAVSPDSTRVAFAGMDRLIHVADAASGETVQLFAVEDAPLNSLAFSPDGQTLACGGKNGFVTLWDLAKGERRFSLGIHSGPVSSVAFSADGKILAAASLGEVRLWNAETGGARGNVGSFEGAVLAVAFSPDGRWLAAAAKTDNTAMAVSLFQADTGVLEWSLLLNGDAAQVSNLQFSRDSRRLATGGVSGEARVLDVDNGRTLARMAAGTESLHGVALSPDGERLITADAQGLQAWNLASGDKLWTASAALSLARSVAFSSDGQFIAVGRDKEVRLCHPATGEPVLAPLHSQVVYVALSPDQRWLAVADGQVSLWDLTTRQQAHSFGSGVAVAFSPDGQLLATAAGEVQVWQLSTRKILASHRQHKQAIWSLAFAPDGRWLASAGLDGAVLLWDPKTGAIVQRFEHPTAVKCLALTRDGRYLAAGLNKLPGATLADVTTWDTQSGQKQAILPTHSSDLWWLAYSPDGSRLASSTYGALVRIWDPAAKQQLLELNDNQGSVSGMAFSPDGKMLVTCGTDRRLILWDALNGSKLREWSWPPLPQRPLFAADGRHLLIGNFNGTVSVLRLPPSGGPGR